MNRNGEFTVNIALIDGNEPVFGIVGVPVQERVYVGDVRQTNPDQRAYVLHQGNSKPLHATRHSERQGPIRVVASRNHGGERLEAYLREVEARFAGCERTPVGSSQS